MNNDEFRSFCHDMIDEINDTNEYRAAMSSYIGNNDQDCIHIELGKPSGEWIELKLDSWNAAYWYLKGITVTLE